MAEPQYPTENDNGTNDKAQRSEDRLRPENSNMGREVSGNKDRVDEGLNGLTAASVSARLATKNPGCSKPQRNALPSPIDGICAKPQRDAVRIAEPPRRAGTVAMGNTYSLKDVALVGYRIGR